MKEVRNANTSSRARARGTAARIRLFSPRISDCVECLSRRGCEECERDRFRTPSSPINVIVRPLDVIRPRMNTIVRGLARSRQSSFVSRTRRYQGRPSGSGEAVLTSRERERERSFLSCGERKGLAEPRATRLLTSAFARGGARDRAIYGSAASRARPFH